MLLLFSRSVSLCFHLVIHCSDHNNRKRENTLSEQNMTTDGEVMRQEVQQLKGRRFTIRSTRTTREKKSRTVVISSCEFYSSQLIVRWWPHVSWFLCVRCLHCNRLSNNTYFSCFDYDYMSGFLDSQQTIECCLYKKKEWISKCKRSPGKKKRRAFWMHTYYSGNIIETWCHCLLYFWSTRVSRITAVMMIILNWVILVEHSPSSLVLVLVVYFAPFILEVFLFPYFTSRTLYSSRE